MKILKTVTWLFVVALFSAPAEAQPRTDDKFGSWLGCWRLEEDLAGTGARMCISPDQGGVRLQTLLGDRGGIDELLIPDGVARPVVDAACQGSQHARWSADGLRVFRSVAVTCEGETPRTVKSVAFLSQGPTWINVQHVSGEGGAAIRVQRYRRAADQRLADGSQAPQPTTPPTLSAGELNWSVEDVIEASERLPAEALQAALGEAQHGFNLNKKSLVAMHDAGVPGDVIDLMVALTFPKRFVVERAGGSSPPVGVSTGMGWYDPFFSPVMSGYDTCFAPGFYGYRSYYCGGLGSMYAPFGYYAPVYGYGYPNYYPPGGWFPVDPGVGSPGPAVPSAEGRVVNGQGYTRIRERSPEPAAPRVSGGGDGSAAGWSGASRGGSGSGVSSQGYSSGGSSSGSSGSGSSGGSSGSDSGARTAVPRPGGGGY